MRLALLIAIYAVIAIVAALFMGTSVPPCFGSVPDGRMSQACIDQWLANRGFVEWFFSTPWSAVALFILASGLTIWWSRRRGHASRRALRQVSPRASRRASPREG